MHDPDDGHAAAADGVDLDLALGREIRARRVAAGMSLRALASATDLSPSFVSQLERGLARPRITSLHRVARTLGTTAQALLSSGETRSYSLVRRNTARSVEHSDDGPSRPVASLVTGDRPITVLEFRGLPEEFGQYFEHPGEEVYLVIGGRVEVELDGDLVELGAGDCLAYDGRLPHRSRQIGDEDAAVYLITSRTDVQPG